MRKARMLVILVLGVLVCVSQLASAEPMGTAFTYQGQLYDANYPANGKYDFAFKLYEASSDGNKVGIDVNVADVNVIDGYFTVKLDFGSDVFSGDARWLGTGIRPGDLNDPNAYTTLSPRQEVAPAPHAIYAETSGSTNGGDSIPAGIIVMWSGTIGDIPSGWALCNGDSNTPDLRDRFIVAASQDDGGIAKTNITGSLTQTGGSISHSHTGSTSTGIWLSSGCGQGCENGHYHTFTTNSSEHISPYYALAYIMKLP